MTMSKSTIGLMALSTLLILTSLSLLALAANTLAYTDANATSDLQIHYIRWNETANAQYSYWLQMDYTPSRFTLAHENAMVASGVVCAVVGAIAILTSTLTPTNKPTTARFGAPLIWLLTAIATAGAFAVSLAVAVYAWSPVMRWPINFLKSLPVPSKISGTTSVSSSDSITYQAPFAFTPEVWNCRIAPYAADASTSERLQGLCQEAKAAKGLAVVVVVVAAMVMGMVGLKWWKAGKQTKAEGEVEAKDVDEEMSVVSKD